MGSRRGSILATREHSARKLQAAELFVDRLLASPAKAHVASIWLYGSAGRGETTVDSDVDLFIIATGSLSAVKEASNDAASDVLLQLGEDVEPLVRSLSQWKEIPSWLIYRARMEGKELYCMDARTIKRKEMDSLYELASVYLQATNRLLASGNDDEGSARLAIDGGYNVIELCAKAFLLSRLEVLPKSHGGVKALFSDHFIKTGILPRDFGRRFSHCLQYRHEARYDPAAEVTRDKAEAVANFAAQIVSALEKYLMKSGS